MKLEVNLSGYDIAEEGFEAALVDATARKLADAMKDTINARIDALIDATASAILAERIEGEIATILSEGWFETDSYGHRNGKKVTLADRIELALTTKDAYSKTAVVGLVDRTIQKRFDDQMADATKRLKAKVDELINGTIEEVVTSDIRAKLRKALV